MPVHVRYRAQLVLDSEGFFTITDKEPTNVTLGDIKAHWPFQGNFHFRVKVPDSTCAFAWLDLVKDDEPVPSSGHTELVIKVVCLDHASCFADPLPTDKLGEECPALPPAAADAVARDYAARSEARALTASSRSFDLARYGLPCPPAPRHRGDSARAASGAVSGSNRGAGAGVGVGARAGAGASVGVGAAGGAGGAGPAVGAPGSYLRADAATVRALGEATANIVGNAASVATSAASAVASDAKRGVRRLFKAGKFLARVGMKHASGLLATPDSGAGAVPRKVPTVDALVNLHEMQVFLQTSFAPEFPPHEKLLRRLWIAAYGPGAPMVRVSPKWQRLGFQQADPGTDFRGGGLLGLHCNVYWAETHPTVFKPIVKSQVAHGERNYPVAAAGINMAIMLSNLVHLTHEDVATVKERYWGMFTDYRAFFELFCLAMRLFHQQWVRRRARISDFQAVLEGTKQQVAEVLAQGPSSLAAFLEMGAAATAS